MKYGFSVMYDGSIWSDAEIPYTLTNFGIEKVFSITDNFEISTSFNRFFTQMEPMLKKLFQQKY